VKVSLRQQLAESSHGDGERNPKCAHPVFVSVVQAAREAGTRFADDVLREQAKRFGKELGLVDGRERRFSCSDGWLSGFKNHFGTKATVLHSSGEAERANTGGIALARGNVRLLLEGYSADDIFNQVETGMFWRQTLARRLATGNKTGRKKDKQGITASLAYNASGMEKAQLFLIGKAKRPRSYPKSFQPERDLNIRYSNNIQDGLDDDTGVH
jgi:hypothetical protein